MEKEKSNKGLIIALVAIAAIALVVVILFATGTINLKPKEGGITNTPSNNVQTPVEGEIQTKIIENNSGLVEENSENTFNDMTVKIEKLTNDSASENYKLFINNKDVTEDIDDMFLYSYAFFDNNVIVHSGSTGGGFITIFTNNEGNIEKTYKEGNIDGYKLDGFIVEATKLILTGRECGAECGEKDTDNKYAAFEMEYQNGTFTTPKLIKKMISKKVEFDLENCKTVSETIINGVTVKVTNKKDGDSCQLTSININGKDVLEKETDLYLNSYEIYDNNVILNTSNSGAKYITIYSTKNNEVTKVLRESMFEDYRFESYGTRYSKIVISGKECGEQCGKKPSGYPTASFVIEYNNETFGTPKLSFKSK